MSSADNYFGVIDELTSVLKSDLRMATIKEYIFGEKEVGLKFPSLFILPDDDIKTFMGESWPGWDIKIYLVLVDQNMNLEQGKKNVMRMAWDISDILNDNRTLDGKVHDVNIDRIMHNTGKDNQGRVLHWEMLELTIKQRVFESGSVPTDPWLEALCLWTEKELGPDWTVYRNTYPEKYNKPAVIWKLASGSTREKTRAMFEIRKNFVGMALGKLPYQHAFFAGLAIIEGLRRDIKIPLDIVDKRYLTVEDPNVDIKTGLLVPGQISVTLTRLTNRPTEEVPLMMKVFRRGELT